MVTSVERPNILLDLSIDHFNPVSWMDVDKILGFMKDIASVLDSSPTQAAKII